MKSEFLRPHLVGPRFDEHTIPIEVLKDWAAFENLVIETAKWLYLQKYPERQRVPRGFASGFALHLSGVQKGSAVPVLDRIHPPASLIPGPYSEFFDQARDRILEVISAAATGMAIDHLLPRGLLSFFDQFGRSLRDDERMEFVRDSQRLPVTYTKAVRKGLVLRNASEYRSEEEIRGSVVELNVKSHTFTFEFISGLKAVGMYGPEVRDEAHSALAEYEASKALALVRCIVVRDQSDTAKSIESVTHIEVLDPLDVTARLEQISLLRDGWLDGDGLAPAKDGLRWLRDAWKSHWPEDVALPHLYPTAAGGVQAEWEVENLEVSAEFDLSVRNIDLLVVDTDNGTVITEKSIQLDIDHGWQEFAGQVRNPAKS